MRRELWEEGGSLGILDLVLLSNGEGTAPLGQLSLLRMTTLEKS